MHIWIVVLALLAPASVQADLKNSQPALDGAGRPIPGHFTVTICRGTFYDMTPTNRGRDRYSTPHDARVTRTSGSSARGGGQGTNGTIRLTSGAPGLSGPLGQTTIEYDIIDDSTGQRAQHVVVRVNVIDCPPPARAGGNQPPAAVPTSPEQPPTSVGPLFPQAPVRPGSNRTATHRTTSCAACQSIAAELNAASDRGASAEVTRLSAALTECESTCTQRIIDEDNAQWQGRLGFGYAGPRGQLGREASAGWNTSASLYRFISPSFSLGFKIDLSKFKAAESMPSDFSASQTTLSIDTVYSFGDDRIEPYVAAGAGMSRNTLNFGESSISTWKPGFSVGGGVDFRINTKMAIGAGLRYQKFDTFGSYTINGTYSFTLQRQAAAPATETFPSPRYPKGTIVKTTLRDGAVEWREFDAAGKQKARFFLDASQAGITRTSLEVLKDAGKGGYLELRTEVVRTSSTGVELRSTEVKQMWDKYDHADRITESIALVDTNDLVTGERKTYRYADEMDRHGKSTTTKIHPKPDGQGWVDESGNAVNITPPDVDKGLRNPPGDTRRSPGSR